MANALKVSNDVGGVCFVNQDSIRFSDNPSGRTGAPNSVEVPNWHKHVAVLRTVLSAGSRAEGGGGGHIPVIYHSVLSSDLSTLVFFFKHHCFCNFVI